MIKAQIIPQRQRGNVTIVGSYKNRNTDKEVFLSTSGKKVLTTLNENERVFQYTFESGYPLEIILDEDDFAEKAVIDFWKNHPLIFTDGYTNPNLIAEHFKFEIKNEKIKVEYDSLIGKLEVVSEVSAMSFADQFNLAFALGGNPRSMTEKELYLYLVGLTLNGIAVARRDFVKTFLSTRQNEKVATIYANKAISYGIVTKDQSVYKVAGQNAGTTVDSVVALIMTNSDLFENYIKPEVDKFDKNEIMQFETVAILEIPEELKDLLPVGTALDKRKARKLKED
jgi:hypothetical protein